ncbi:daple-like protein, partial [Myotis lucifugus]|uniref:daple-like protein n=1 Tax=Myotis lucifugus TaxID=59463 RepID=UPI0006D7279A
NPNGHSLGTSDCAQPSFPQGKPEAQGGCGCDCGEHGAEAGSAPEPWDVWLSTPRLTSWTEVLQGEQEELRTQKQELQASLEKEQQKLRICQAEYRDLKAEQLPKEILLNKLSIQYESLTRAKKDWQEERGHLRRERDTLKELNQSILNACDEHWTERSDTLKTMPTGKAEEGRTGESQEAQCPAPRKKKRWSRARAFLKFFQRQRDGSRGQAKSPPDSLPGPLEAMPSCSYWEEEGDARRGPPPKAKGQRKSAFWSRKKQDKVKDQPPVASSAWSKILKSCTSGHIPPSPP